MKRASDLWDHTLPDRCGGHHFLRRFPRRKDGKVHAYWALVESYRTARGSRQRMVAYLGELQDGEQAGWARLGNDLDGKPPPAATLVDPPPVTDEPAAVLVELRGIRLERLRACGDVWLALGLWRLLELDVLLERLIVPGREDVPWPTVAAILTIARLCAPHSELHIETTWYRGTALDDLLGVPSERVHTDRLYAGLDQLLPHQGAIEKQLRQRVCALFSPSQELLIYDVTSTYFEGQCPHNPQAKRGYSRDHRPDCLQGCIGLVVTEDGLPMGYEVFAGNRQDSTTLTTIVDAMERKLVCFLAYVLWKSLAQWMRRAGLGDAPRPLVAELAKIRSGDVVLPTQRASGEAQRLVRLRCVTEPDAAQKVLLDRLGLRLPRRPRQHASADAV